MNPGETQLSASTTLVSNLSPETKLKDQENFKEIKSYKDPKEPKEVKDLKDPKENFDFPLVEQKLDYPTKDQFSALSFPSREQSFALSFQMNRSLTRTENFASNFRNFPRRPETRNRNLWYTSLWL